MAKSSTVRSCDYVDGTKVLGVTKDGVRILKPKGKATHFTLKELRKVIAAVRMKRA